MPLKKGATDKQLFSNPDYTCLGNPYQPAKTDMARSHVIDGHLKAGHEVAFKPAKAVRDKYGYAASYAHIEENPDVKKKNYRDEDGAVIIGPRNFTTKPLKKGIVGKGTTFEAPLPHMAEGYEQHKVEAKEKAKSHLDFIAKTFDGKNFSQRCKVTGYFNSNKNVIGEDVPLPARVKQVRKVATAEHERAFRPSKPPRTGYACTLSKFPEHLPNPPKQLTRKQPVEGEPEAPPAFRMTHKYKSRPSQSVATNFRNLKASFPSAFRR